MTVTPSPKAIIEENLRLRTEIGRLRDIHSQELSESSLRHEARMDAAEADITTLRSIRNTLVRDLQTAKEAAAESEHKYHKLRDALRFRQYLSGLSFFVLLGFSAYTLACAMSGTAPWHESVACLLAAFTCAYSGGWYV